MPIRTDTSYWYVCVYSNIIWEREIKIAYLEDSRCLVAVFYYSSCSSHLFASSSQFLCIISILMDVKNRRDEIDWKSRIFWHEIREARISAHRDVEMFSIICFWRKINLDIDIFSSHFSSCLDAKDFKVLILFKY